MNFMDVNRCLLTHIMPPLCELSPDYDLVNYISRFAVGPWSWLRTARSERSREDTNRSIFFNLRLHKYDSFNTATACIKR